MDSLKRNMPVIHPGQFLKEELIVANNLTIREVAGMLKYPGKRYPTLLI